MIFIDKESKLTIKALEIGTKYGQADKPIKIEVGKLMTGKRKILRKKKRA